MTMAEEHDDKRRDKLIEVKGGPEHVDSIFRALNPTGRYQILHLITLLLSVPAAGFQLFSNVFVVKRVPHLCAAPPEGSNWTDLFGDTENLTVIREKCEISLRDNFSVLETTSCVYGNEYTLDVDKSLISQFDLVCDMDWLARFTQTMVIVGQGIGAMLSTFLSDRYGRKVILVGSNLGLLVFGVASAYAPNPFVFLVLKFLIGGCQQGVLATMTTFFLELLTVERRAMQAWVSGTVWGLGVVLLAVIAYILRDYSWRTLQIVVSLASLTGFFQWWYLDESLRWLLANGRPKEAKRVIKRIARVNDRREDGILQLDQINSSMINTSKEDKAAEIQGDFEVEATERLTLIDLLRIRRLFLNAVCIWSAWFTAAISFFTIYLTSTSLSGDPYLNFGLTALMELPSNMFFYFCLARLGRKKCMYVVYGVMGLGVVLAGIFKKLEEHNPIFTIFTLLSSLIAMCGAGGCFGMVFAYTPEMFPTNLRSQAIGVSSFAGRIGGMLAPFAGLLAEQAVWAPGLVIGIFACIVCILSSFLPETARRELPQTVSQLQAWFKGKDAKSMHGRASPDHNGAL